MPRYDHLWINARLARMTEDDGYAVLENGAIATREQDIVWVGPMDKLQGDAGKVHDVAGRWITPGLVDCHTHLVFAGDRSAEFEQRQQGKSYEEIARAGGGILATVAATRAADEDALYAASLPRLRRLMSEGVTTVEIKSGYGLTLEDELKMLRVARRLGESEGITVKTTFLAAHTVPPEYADDRAGYVKLICEEMLPALEASGLGDAFDIFCETIGFSHEESETILARTVRHALSVKVHADQLSDMGAAALAAKFSALSADHLEYTSEAGIQAMAKSQTVAVLLPVAYYSLRQTQPPPVAAMRRHGVPMAVASDGNPGSAPCLSLLTAMNMACVLFGLTPAEALAGATRNAAQALGLQDRGMLALGYRADLAVWDIDNPAELAYWIGHNPLHAIVRAGTPHYI